MLQPIWLNHGCTKYRLSEESSPNCPNNELSPKKPVTKSYYSVTGLLVLVISLLRLEKDVGEIHRCVYQANTTWHLWLICLFLAVFPCQQKRHATFFSAYILSISVDHSCVWHYLLFAGSEHSGTNRSLTDKHFHFYCHTQKHNHLQHSVPTIPNWVNKK